MAAPGLFDRHRLLALAMAGSAALHGAVIVGAPGRVGGAADPQAAVYSATLAPAAATLEPQAPPPAPMPRPRVRHRPTALPLLPLEDLASVTAGASDAGEVLMQPLLEPLPEVVALAEPAVPLRSLHPPPFPTEALPANVRIDYTLTSSFADGRAVYEWKREGDRYEISGEAEAVGFFTLFLEGRVLQESRGALTAEGLRPERFREMKPNAATEGLDFDWDGRRVVFDRGDERHSSELTDNTVDWLSMIFQLAHRPPRGERLDLRVFTQRRLYEFRLAVLGEELLETPLGTLRTIHLRHDQSEKQREPVDVWLGIDHHYLPVKLRYPVARNRLVVEQTATRITSPGP